MATACYVGAAAPGPVTPTSDNAPGQGRAEGDQKTRGEAYSASSRALRATPLTPRHRRALHALLAGPVTREQIDAIVGASNGPDEVLKLRRKYLMVIPCERQRGFDRDQHRVEFGVYRLAATDRPIAAELVRGGAQ